MSDALKISQRAAELGRGQELAEAIASALGTSLRHYMPTTKEKAVETATMFLAKVEGAAPLIEALRKSSEGWANAIEMGLLPPQHLAAARVLADEGREALRKAGAL